MAGVLAISAGVWLIAGGPGWRHTALNVQERARLRLGLVWGALTGATIACYTVIDGYAMRIALLLPLVYDYFANVFRLPWLAPLVATRRSAARLRSTLYRGQVSAAMLYDHQPIVDVFRRLDPERLLGVMDCKGMARPFFFVLRREGG